MIKFLLILAVLFLAACSPNEQDYKTDVPETPTLQDRITASQLNAELEKEDSQVEEGGTSQAEKQGRSKDEATESTALEVEMPKEINLTVPFYSQAPEGDWAQPWQDACEEASLVLAHYGLKGEALTKAEFKKQVLAMVDWENTNFGYFESTPVEKVVQLYEGFFDDAFKVTVMEDPTVEEMKKELAQGHLIVGPFAGRMLKNPFYSGEGPYYHMMVLKGYDEKHFITNDVGTRRGENFIYPYQTILDAMHDYKEPGIESQPSRVIVLSN